MMAPLSPTHAPRVNGLNWASPQAKGLVYCGPLQPGRMTWDFGPNSLFATQVGFDGDETTAIHSLGQCVSLATNDTLTVPHHACLNLPGDFAIAFWLYAVSDGGGSFGIFDKVRGDQASPAWSVHADAAATVLRFQPSLGGASVSIDSAAGSYAAARLIHGCIRRRSSTFQWFVNGVPSGTPTTNAGAIGTNSTAAIVGALSDGFTIPSGTIAHIRVYNRALTDTEIGGLFHPATRWALYGPQSPIQWGAWVGASEIRRWILTR